MRKTILVYLIGVLILAFAVVKGTYVFADDGVRRHHQHQERPSEADLGECLHCDENVLCTHLPLIVIDTFGQTIPGRPLAFGTGRYSDLETLENFHTGPNGETEIEVSVLVIDNHESWNHEHDIPLHESMATMRIRGNSSRFFDKPNFRIQLIDEHGFNNPLPLLGMGEHHEWALHGPFLDKTLMRNYMWMNVAADVMGPGHFVPEVRFFELILNGEFQGLYVLMETIRISPDRVSLNNYREGMPVTSYLMRLDSNYRTPERNIGTFADYTYRLEMGRQMEILYPRIDNQSEAIQHYVATSISITERLLYSPEMIWYPRLYEQYIDVNSFINYFIINEFIINNDLWANSTYIHKDVRSHRIVAGPVWDFNNIMDNFFLETPYSEFYLVERGWFDRLMMCPSFTDRVIRRYNYLRRDGGALSEARLINYQQEVADWLGSAVERNFEVWGYSFDPTQVSIMARRLATRSDAEARVYRHEGMSPEEFDAAVEIARYEILREVNPQNFEAAMEHHRDFTIARGRWLDRHIETIRQFSHPSRHALWTLQ